MVCVCVVGWVCRQPHPNIVPLKDVFVSLRGNLYLVSARPCRCDVVFWGADGVAPFHAQVFELLDRDLKQHMDTLPPKTGVGVGKAKLYVYQLLCGTPCRCVVCEWRATRVSNDRRRPLPFLLFRRFPGTPHQVSTSATRTASSTGTSNRRTSSLTVNN